MDVDPKMCLKELCLYYNSLHNRVYDRNGEHLQLARVDYRAKFTQESKSYVDRSQNKEETKGKVKEVYNRCQSFLIEAAAQ